MATTNATLAEIRTIVNDHLDYDTEHLHYILHVIDGNYGHRDDAAKLAAIQDIIDTDEERLGISEIAAAIG